MRQVARTVRSAVRERDLVARWGGEEIVFLLPDTDREGAREVAEKVRRAVEGLPFLWQGKRLDLSMTLGVAELEQIDDEGLADAVRRADAALYEGKERGRNAVAV
ncbi:MAG: GGDEF domain-containing protein [Acidobacteria bacterium]|nr:MAG: GGDEF domain-containing protein [Acidobacteriota bacterium]REK08486.1 MAG: GGDEF domain-containing protein [Acidobacteriota bacterium]